MAENDDKTDTAAYWKAKASSFSDYYSAAGLSLKLSVSAFLDSRTRMLRSLAGWDERSIVLDLGCGSGVHLQEIALRCRSVVGVDYSPQMLRLAQSGLRPFARANGSLVLADADAVPFAGERFDWIVSMGLLDYVPSPAAVLAECRRVLRPGGVLIASLPKSPSLFGMLRTAPGEWIKAKLFDLPPIRNVFSRAGVLALFREQGFAVSDLRVVWSTMWIAKAVRSAARG